MYRKVRGVHAVMDYKDLQNMLKNDKTRKKLLQNEEFKNEIKRVLCKEQITDKQILDIIENFEKALKYGVLLSDEELENVSGGAPTKPEKIKTGVTLVGDVLGYALGQAFNVYVLNPRIENLDFVKKAKNGSYGAVPDFIVSKAAPWLTSLLVTCVTTFVGSEVGSRIGNSICESWNIED